MTAPSTTARAFTFTLTEQEREDLVTLLAQAVRDKQIEVHRTESFEYRPIVERQAALLQRLLDELRRF
jgi:hypothetical protein